MGISVGLVGLGSFGRAFADLFKTHPLVGRVGLCDFNADLVKAFADREDWQDKFHPRDAYASLDEICAADFDALVIITQQWLHAPQCIQALRAGKHVYSAVSISSVPDGGEILDWCDRLVDTVKRTGRHYMLGETTYYFPQATYGRRRAAEGAFGSFIHSEGEYFHAFDNPRGGLREVLANYRSGKGGEEYERVLARCRKHGVKSGPMHYPTHSVSGPMCVMGARAVKVSAWGQRPEHDDPWFEGRCAHFANETALFQMSNGATMRICEHRECVASLGRETFRVYGTEGAFENDAWCTHEGHTKVTPEEMRDPLPEEVAAAWRDPETGAVQYGGHKGSHAYLVHEFVDAVAHERRPAISIWDAVRYVAAGVTAHRSALRDGERLDVPDWGDPPA